MLAYEPVECAKYGLPRPGGGIGRAVGILLIRSGCTCMWCSRRS